MNILNLEEYALVSARPTCGKSVLALNADNCFILDTDFITFDALEDWLLPDDYQMFRAKHNQRTSKEAALKRQVIEPLMLFFMQFEIPDLVWITNLCPARPIIEAIRCHSKTLFVTRDPDDAWQIFVKRDGERNRPLRISESEVKSWYQVPDWAYDVYDDVVVLEEGEYLCDVFGIEPQITETDRVDNALHREFREVFNVPGVDRKIPLL